MKKWIIIGVLLVIVAVTVWYFAYAKKDQDRLESTERKRNQANGEPQLTVVKSASGTIGTPRGGANYNPTVATAGRGKGS